MLEGYPWLSIQRDDSLSTTNPYATLFSVANEGYIPLTDLDANCGPDFGDTKYTFGIRDSALVYHHFAQWLAHSDRVTLPCFHAINLIGGTDLAGQLKASDIVKLTISVSYTFMYINVPFLRRSETFNFSAVRADDGSLHWKFIH